MRRAEAMLVKRLGATVCALLMACVSSTAAWAGGARFMRGYGLWVQAGYAEVWGVSQLNYFTDPGDLAPNVPHAQADAMVAAAAAVWNVPTSSLTLAHGGELAEHVSSANTYFDGTEVVFPADVQTSNEAAMPVAVIYDTDGSITDLLLGQGASDPSGCRQNAVTESVDDIQLDGDIHHALLILNGRCVGSTPQQLTQMQYQLARAFGRILGIAWSQTNDNVFTAASTVTANQEAYWPLMHPLDVVCGIYTYQCMINPFTLRPDDISALALLYPVTQPAAGKQLTEQGMLSSWGWINFPTGQGMDWVNVTTQLNNWGVLQDWQVVSGVSGYPYQQAISNPVTQVQAVNQGDNDASIEGFFYMAAIPIYGMSTVIFATEPINPLYTGMYALGPYVRPPTTPSGTSQNTYAVDALGGQFQGFMTAWNGASSCAPGNDGTETAPASFDPSGWHDGLICGWGHNAWWTTTVKAGHTWTLEVTATDESGAASTYKLQPVLGVWQSSDAAGSLPTQASQAVPFNSMALGLTQVQMASPSSDTTYRFVISDQYGAGRPDFTYVARVLYAESVTPASLGAGGGTLTITGTGFRPGNVVQVNGVTATVQSWTPTQITAIAPSSALSGAPVGVPVAVTVLDPATGGTTSIGNAVTYTSAPDLLEQISAPSALATGVTAATPFAVKVLASDGTPLSGATVSFTVAQGSAAFGICGTATSCTVTTDSHGVAQTSVSGLAAGPVTLTATEMSGGATVQITLTDTAPVQSLQIAPAPVYVAAGAGGSWTLQATATQDGSPVTGLAIDWTTTSGLSADATPSSIGPTGTASITVSADSVAAGSTQSVTACGWNGICANWSLYGVDPSQWQVSAATGAGQSVSETQQLGAVGLLVTDGAGHPLEGAPVTVYQRVLAWEGACPVPGRCPAAPVLQTTEQSEISDANGMIAVTPVQLPGIPQTIQIAASTGTQGFVILTLQVTP